MYFTGAKFLSNNLKGTEDIVIFVLLCKIIYSLYASKHGIIMHSVAKSAIFIQLEDISVVHAITMVTYLSYVIHSYICPPPS